MNERIKGYFKLLVRLNYLKTLYFNFKMLPLKDACKFPFLFFGKVEFGTLTGSIVISSSIKTGMFRWGVMIDGFTSSKVSSHFSLGRKARLEINGRVDVGCGVVFRILGDLTLLNNSFIGSRTVVACSHKIFLGEFVRVAFGNVLMDTNHHYIVHDGCVHRKEGSILLEIVVGLVIIATLVKDVFCQVIQSLLLEVLWRRIIENVASIVY